MLHQEDSDIDTPPLAQAMMMFMVRGLFTPLRFAYPQFPCAKVTGELLFEPFWTAIYRLERMTFKVVNYVLMVKVVTDCDAWSYNGWCLSEPPTGEVA
jgi:hypothetical protein